jgi:hypothetical protein
MKTAILLCSVLLMSKFSFCQDVEEAREIYFEGTVEGVSAYDGVSYVLIKITSGELAGKTENFYFNIGFHDTLTVECTGNAEFDFSGNEIGRKIKGKVIESTGEFENYETGDTETKKCYRPIELNWI